MPKFVPPPKLGVGFTYLPGLQAAAGPLEGLIDFFELSPDALCCERVRGGARSLDYHPQMLSEALSCFTRRPIVVHGLGLSIGSAAGWNEGYLRILDALHARQPFAWHSEHLTFMQTADPGGRPLHTGVPLPLPYTDEACDLVARRAELLGRRYGVPFLLENLTHYLPDLPAEGGRDEAAFLNELTERSGCGLLLDLYNLQCNAVNLGFDPTEMLARLRLDRVVEIHIAGGVTQDGFMMDVHWDVVPEEVWQMLDWVAPRTPHLAGVVYEILIEAFDVLGIERIRGQLERVRRFWERHCETHGREVSYAAG